MRCVTPRAPRAASYTKRWDAIRPGHNQSPISRLMTWGRRLRPICHRCVWSRPTIALSCSTRWREARMRVGWVITGLWMVWGLSWPAASFWSAPIEKTPSAGSGLRYRLMLLAGGLAIALPWHNLIWGQRLWAPGQMGAWACATLIALGIAFAWWARLHLGRLWSAQVSRKAGHRLVDTGPYALVRHPIYSGLLVAVLASVAARATPGALLGAASLSRASG